MAMLMVAAVVTLAVVCIVSLAGLTCYVVSIVVTRVVTFLSLPVASTLACVAIGLWFHEQQRQRCAKGFYSCARVPSSSGLCHSATDSASISATIPRPSTSVAKAAALPVKSVKKSAKSSKSSKSTNSEADEKKQSSSSLASMKPSKSSKAEDAGLPSGSTDCSSEESDLDETAMNNQMLEATPEADEVTNGDSWTNLRHALRTFRKAPSNCSNASTTSSTSSCSTMSRQSINCSSVNKSRDKKPSAPPMTRSTSYTGLAPAAGTPRSLSLYSIPVEKAKKLASSASNSPSYRRGKSAGGVPLTEDLDLGECGNQEELEMEPEVDADPRKRSGSAGSSSAASACGSESGVSYWIGEYKVHRKPGPRRRLLS